MWRLRGCVIHAFVFAMCVMALQWQGSRQLGLGRPIIFAAVLVMCEFDLVCDREHVEEAGEAVEQDWLNNPLVQQQEVMGGNTESFEFA